MLCFELPDIHVASGGDTGLVEAGDILYLSSCCGADLFNAYRIRAHGHPCDGGTAAFGECIQCPNIRVSSGLSGRPNECRDFS